MQDYLSANGGKANPDAVYFVWSGGNDIPTAAGAGSSNASTVATAAANSLATQIGVLNKAGAKLIIAPNLPSFGNTPAAMYAVIDGATTDESTRNTLKGIVAGRTAQRSHPHLSLANSPDEQGAGSTGGSTKWWRHQRQHIRQPAHPGYRRLQHQQNRPEQPVHPL